LAWDPDLYLRFARFREQPALDLLARLEPRTASLIYDLGCGTGGAARRLADGWPQARVIGLDSSAEMLAKAQSGGGRVVWQQGDAAGAAAISDADILFSNAVFNWIADHPRVLPALLARLRPEGQFAFQMPRNYEQPSHTLIADVIAEGSWAGRLDNHLARPHVMKPADYYRCLGPHCADLEIWETDYVHRLEGEDPVFVWLSGTALRPLLGALDPGERPDFETALQAKLRRAYPRGDDGLTLFAMKRLFIYARR